MSKQPSEFIDLAGVEYFKFEEDFIEENVRCIPMIVRFKMDAAGIKLKLAEWSKFTVGERKQLAVRSCTSEEETRSYNHYLSALVKKYSGLAATAMEIPKNPEWADPYLIPVPLQERALQLNKKITITAWRELTHLQRFALLKLCRPGHESKNFIKALHEFKIG